MTQEQGSSGGCMLGNDVVSLEEVRRIIIDGDAAILVNCAERLGRRLTEGNLASHQMLGICGDIWRIEMAWPASPAEAQHRLHMLKAKLAYLAERAREMSGSRETVPEAELRAAMGRAIDVVLERTSVPEGEDTGLWEAFGRLASFFEATVAYYHCHDGSDQGGMP